MRKILISIICALCVGTAFAAGENVATSKAFVDTTVAQKQDKIPANSGTAQVLTNTGSAGTVGTKDIYDSSATYANQTTALVDAQNMNAAVQNAIDTEFECIQYNPNDSTDCWLVRLAGITEVPSGYTQLEYLESDGEQYINTNTHFMYGDEFFFEYMPVARYSVENKGYAGGGAGAGATITGGGRNAPYGDGETYQQPYISMYVIANHYYYSPLLLYDNTLGNRYIEHWNINPGTGRFSSILTDISNHLSYTITGPTVSSSYNSAIPIYLWRDGKSPHEYPSKERIYATWLKRSNGTMAFNLIPARRDSDGVLGMYDLVSGTFLTNSGTGNFIAGPMIYMPSNN